MKERGIIFQADMVRAILDGRKTQTRRVVNPQPKKVYGLIKDPTNWYLETERLFKNRKGINHPYGKPGDLLYVRETWKPTSSGVRFKVDEETKDHPSGCFPTTIRMREGWYPSIHMPKWAARLWLEIVNVRVERVQDILEDDSINEGCPECPDCQTNYNHGQWGRGAIDDPLSLMAGERPYRDCRGLCNGETAREWFKNLWDSINGEKPGCSWNDDPWVWVVEFKKIER